MRNDQKYIAAIRESLLNIFSKYSAPRWMVFLTDGVIVFAVFLFAYIVRFNFELNEINQQIAVSHATVVLVFYLVFSLIFKSYSGLLRHTTLTDISLIFLVTTSSTLALTSAIFLNRAIAIHPSLNIPLSVLLIYYVTITVALFFERVFIKLVFRFATNPYLKTKNVLIYGAGELGFIVKRVILSDPKYGFHVKGFIDNDKNLQGKKINQIPVYDNSVLSPDFLKKNRIEGLILAVKDISIEEKGNIIRKAVNLSLETLETPEVDKWVSGQINHQQFRRVKLEDLLGREPIKLNMEIIKSGLKDKTILITGSAGSIGSEIVRQLARFNSKSVILVDQAETPMFYLEKELREKFIDLRFHLIIGDVTNRVKMEKIFRDYRPEIVFHAAAYKHVSVMEENPHEAVRVNVGGTKVLTDLALAYNVEKFVMISTDKSVNPTSVMGASKRICEELVQCQSQREGISTQFIVTRFGNVLGSNGSVIPIFSKQIQDGGPVTVTHPEVYRYFMTIPEACQLVLEAGFMGNGGEIFVFDMGEPVRIADLAINMIRLSGLEPMKDIQIVYTGLRPGEKLFEELLKSEEPALQTHHPKIMKARVEKINGQNVFSKIDLLLSELYSLSPEAIIGKIRDLIPEYVSPSRDTASAPVNAENWK